MAQKRKREENTTIHTVPTKLQKSEKPIAVDLRLVQIYDQLADEKESRRLKAATQLLQKLQDESTTQEDVERALRRLFRGLCSARKAARQGFSVALTELLAQLADKKINVSFSSEQLLNLLDSATTPDSSATKQEDRDHVLGLVFAADAVIKSGILTKRGDRAQWKHLLTKVLTVSQKKTWLRQETGWMLYQFAETVGSGKTASPDLLFFLESIIDALSTHKLIRTSEGVAIWLSAKKAFPDARLSKHVWKHGHPLAAKDINTLADIMKDSRSRSNEEQEMEAQGAALWSASLHFAWKVVLAFLLHPPAVGTKDLVTFTDFWNVVVDQGLFAGSSSTERKQTGLSVLGLAYQAVPLDFLPHTCSKNVVHCLIAGLGGKNTYLQKACEKAKTTLEGRLAKVPDNESSSIPAACLEAVFRATETQDLDALTKSKLLSRAGFDGSRSQRISIINTFNKLRKEQFADKRRHRWILDLQAKYLGALIRDSAASLSGDVLLQMMEPLSSWFDLLNGGHDEFDDDFKAFVKSRIENVLEHCLRGGDAGRSIFTSCVERGVVLPLQKGQIKSNKEIRKIIGTAWRNVDESGRGTNPGSIGQALSLLYCTVIMDVAAGEASSIECLQELIELGDLQDNADSITEILLSLAPRPSRFLRLVSLQVFESISPYLTQDGLDPLTRVLLTKENAKGQQEMFGGAVDDDDDDGEEESGSENDELDSDVEFVDGPDAASEAETTTSNDGNDEEEFEKGRSVGEENGDTSDDGNSDNDDDDDDEQLAAFDAALASALGTRRLEQTEQEAESSDSDVDMDDDQMIALDEKLAEVFKARKEANSKKKERKDTREAFIHFKNRVLDLLEVYLKHEHRNGLAAKLVFPVLQSIRITQTKQIAERTCSILRQFFTKCRGKEVPKVSKEDGAELLTQFIQVHEEASLESSNAHANLASSASILLVKVLLGAGIDINVLVDQYSKTRKRQLTDKSCKVQPSFFSDWNNWCAQARGQLAK